MEDDNVPGLGANVVLKMIRVLNTTLAHKVYFDNIFTGFTLMKYLGENDVRALRIVRANRMNKCPIEVDKQLKKRDRGNYGYRFDSENKIVAVTWHDNTCVKLDVLKSTVAGEKI